MIKMLRRIGYQIGNSRILRNQKLIVFFDGWCPLCQKSVRNLQAIDFFGLIIFKSFRQTDVITTYNLDPAKAEKRMLSKKLTSSTLYEGIDSFILIGLRIPPLWPLVFLMYLAKIFGFGQVIYDYIADRRKIIPSGSCTDKCYLPNK